MSSGTLVAIAIRDHSIESIPKIELWWNGRASEEIKVETGYTYEKKNKNINYELELLNGKKFERFQKFLLKKTQTNVIIEHVDYPEFQLLANYPGRASFVVKVPGNWTTEGLGGGCEIDFL